MSSARNPKLPKPPESSFLLLQQASSSMSDDNPPSAKRAPTLYAIIAFKLLKGSLFVVLAVVLYCLSDNNLPEEYKNFLGQPLVQKILHSLRVHPGNKFFSDLALKIGELTEVNVLWAAAGTLVYSLFCTHRILRTGPSAEIFVVHLRPNDHQHPHRLVSCEKPAPALSPPSSAVRFEMPDRMIGHQAILMHLPARLETGIPERTQKPASILFILEVKDL